VAGSFCFLAAALVLPTIESLGETTRTITGYLAAIALPPRHKNGKLSLASVRRTC
jgi:hypothetical protein